MALLMSQLSLHRSVKPLHVNCFSTRSLPCSTSQRFVVSVKNLPEKLPVGLCGKELRFSAWERVMRRRGSVGVPVVKAAAAADGGGGDQEFDISEGFVFFFSLSDYLLLKY